MNISEKETSALKLYTQAVWRRRYEFLATVVLFLSAITVYTMKQPKVYESSLLLLIGQQQKPQVVTPDKANGDSKGDSEELETEVQVLSTLPLVSQATSALQSQYTLDPKSVADGLKIQQLGKAGIISVTYRDADPKRLVDVLNQLGKTYVDFSLTNRRSQFTNAIGFIEKKLPAAQESLAERSQQLANFRKRNNLVNPNETGSELTKSLAELGEQERTTLAELRQKLTLYNTLEQRLNFLPPERALTVASLSQDPVYLGLLKDYQEAEKQYSLERLRFKDNAPQTQTLKDKRNELNQLLNNQVQQVLGRTADSANFRRLNELQVTQVSQLLEAQNDLKVQQARLAALQTARGQLEKTFKMIPDLQQEYDALARQVQVESENVTRLLSRLEEFRILEAQESANWQVIQPPSQPGKPVSPDIRLNLMVGSVLVLLLGGFVVYVCEQLDKRLRSAESVNELLHLQTLSVIPKTDEKLLHLNAFPTDDSSEQLYFESVVRSQWFAFQAAIQQLLFNLRTIGATKPLKAIGFTSSLPHEGKSITVRHLGLCAAELRYRVLLIDGDLRKPELHLGFKVGNEQGLSEVVTRNLPLREAIQEITPELHLLSAGSTPANSVVLLDSPKMRQLIPQLREQYDLILMDLPPAIGLTDALVAANYLDGLVFLVGLNHATPETLKTSLESLNSVDRQPLGVVCNLAETSDMTYSVYGGSPPNSSRRVPPLRQSSLLQRLMSRLSQRN